MSHKILLLPGDGIGPEVIAEAKRLLAWLQDRRGIAFETEEARSPASTGATDRFDAHGLFLHRHRGRHEIVFIAGDKPNDGHRSRTGGGEQRANWR